MAAGKTLNTSNSLYSNIVRALSGDLDVSKLTALDGGTDTALQTVHYLESANDVYTFTSTQGIARNATHWVAFNTTDIRKYDLTSTQVASNLTPFATLPAGLDHVGDGFIEGNIVYAPLSNYSAGSSTEMGIGKYNLSDLSLIEYYDLSAQTNLNCSGCCLSPDGTEIYITSFYATAGADQRNTDIYRISKATGAFIGILQFTTPSVGIQSIAIHDNKYFIGSYEISGNNNLLYVYDTSFNLVTKIDPLGTGTEMEGVESYNNTLYFHHLNGQPRILDETNLVITRAAGSDPVQFLDSALITDTNTILMRITPRELFNFNSIIDNQTYNNDWEAWIYDTGELAWRVSSTGRTSTAGIVAGTEYIIAFTWSNSAGTVTIKAGVNGVYGAPVNAAWVTPPSAGMWLAGINAGNNQGNHVYKDILVFDKVLSDVELLDAYNNFDDFYVFDDGGITVTATLGGISYLSNNTSLQVSGSIDVISALGVIDYSSNGALVNLAGTIDVITGLGEISYLSNNTVVGVTGSVDVVSALGGISYANNNPVVSLGGNIIVNAALGEINYLSNNAIVDLVGVIQVNTGLGEIIYQGFSPLVQLGAGQKIDNVTVGFADNIYTAGFKPDTITVTFK